MKFGLGPKASDVFVVIYIGVTLYVRFTVEPQLGGNIIISVGLGLFALLFLWALTKSKIINPTWFGLLGNKKDKNS